VECERSVAPNRAVDMTTTVISAYVSNNHVQPCDLLSLISSIHAAFIALGRATPTEPNDVPKPTQAQIRRSLTHEALISFEDGRGYKSLRRHLTVHGLTPQGYRVKWGLPDDYPMTAPEYSQRRSELAKGLRLGRKRIVVPEAAKHTGRRRGGRVGALSD